MVNCKYPDGSDVANGILRPKGGDHANPGTGAHAYSFSRSNARTGIRTNAGTCAANNDD